MNIPMPDAEERRRSIAQIKARGLPQKKTLFSVVGTLLKSFSFEHLFFGMADCLCIALMIFASLIGATQILDCEFVTTLMVAIAPFFYLSMYLLSLWKESMFNTLAVQRVCKFTPMHLTAFRMLAFSLLAVILNIPASFLASLMTPSLFPKLVLLSSCSLFGYASLMTAVQIFTSKIWAHTLLPVLWTACIFGIVAMGSQNLEKWLIGISALKPGILTVVFVLLYLTALNIYVKKGEKVYADR